MICCRYEPYLWENERQSYLRHAVLFGFFVQLNRMYTDTVQKLPTNSESNILRCSTVPRFKYLPIRLVYTCFIFFILFQSLHNVLPTMQISLTSYYRCIYLAPIYISIQIIHLVPFIYCIFAEKPVLKYHFILFLCFFLPIHFSPL